MAAKNKSPAPVELDEESQKIWDEGARRVQVNHALNLKVKNELLLEEEGDFYYMPKHPDKPILGKSGAQKYVEFYNDEVLLQVTHEIFNNTPFFKGKAVLQTKDGVFISDGVSANFPKSGNKDFAFNAAAKMCAKRAYVDCVVTGYKLSPHFFGDKMPDEEQDGAEDDGGADEGAKKKKAGAKTKTAKERREEWEAHMDSLDKDEAEVLRNLAQQIKDAKTKKELEEVGASIAEFVDENDEYVRNTLRSAYNTRQRQISQKKGK